MCLLQFDLTRISNTAYKVLSDELSKMHNVIFDQRCCSIHACIKLLIEYELSAALRGMWSELVSMWHTPQCWLGWGTLPSLLCGRGADRLPFEKGTLVCLVSAKAFFLDLLGKWRGCWYMLIWFFVHWKKKERKKKKEILFPLSPCHGGIHLILVVALRNVLTTRIKYWYVYVQHTCACVCFLCVLVHWSVCLCLSVWLSAVSHVFISIRVRQREREIESVCVQNKELCIL